MTGLQTTVQSALNSLRWSYRATGTGSLELDVPPLHRHRFGDKSTLKLVFDVDVWHQNRQSELVAPGSAVFQGLEDALAEHAARSVRVAGNLVPNGALGAEWGLRMRVLNTDYLGFESPIHYEYSLRWLFEVDLAGPPRVTTLVPVATRLDGAELTASELDAADPNVSYSLDEVAGLLQSAPEWPDAATLERLRTAARAILATRLSGVHGAQDGERTRLFATERRALDEDRADRLDDHGVDEERVEREYESRLDALKARFNVGIEARVRTETLLVAGKEGLRVRVKRRDGTVFGLKPKLLAGALRDDQCMNCRKPSAAYLLSHENPPNLWCVNCGFACAEADCPHVETTATTTCAACSTQKYCRNHTFECDGCAGTRCVEHRFVAICCGATLCENHNLKHSTSDASVCRKHSALCATGGHRVLTNELFACAETGSQACLAHLGQVDEPEGAMVLSSEIRICSQTGRRLHHKRAGICSVNQKIYDRHLLVKSALSGRIFHSQHTIPMDGDDRVLHPDEVVRSHISGVLVGRDRAVLDEFAANAPLHPSEAVQCGATARWTARANTVRSACCNKLVSRTNAVPSTLSGEMVCSRCVKRCDEHPGPLLPTEVADCELGSGIWCIAHLRRVECGTLVGPPAQIRLPDGAWECRAHYGDCSTTKHVVPQSELASCFKSGVKVCTEHRASCRCHGKPVSREVLVADGYDSGLWCPDMGFVCPRCGVQAGRLDAAVATCVWCAQAAPLATCVQEIQNIYYDKVQDLLPWYTIVMRVMASGAPTKALFVVHTLTGQQLRFRASEGRVERPSVTGGWRV